eukprot:superscaffoldBa00000165_g2343
MAEQLKALSIDREDKRLFWVQFGLQGESAIGSCDYNGSVVHIIDQPLRSYSLGISVFLEHLYYTDVASQAIKQINKYTGGEQLNVNTKRMAKPPVDVKVVHPLNQPVADSLSPLPGCDEQSGNCINVCSSLAEQGVCQCDEGFALNKQGTYCEDVNECAHWNHGCSLGCENIPGSYFCTCPKGYALLPDRKTCQGCLSADRGGCSQLCTSVTPTRWQCGCLPGYQLHQDGKHCIATGPPPYLLIANLVDVQRINPDGTGDQTLVEEPRGTIIALDYDPVQNNVYFACTTKKTIERVDLNGGSRDVLVSEGLDSPEGLAIDWVHRKMYWTDKSGLTIDFTEDRLFWCDQRRGVVETAGLDGSDRRALLENQVGRPFDLAVFEDRLWISDREHQQLRSVNKRTGKKLQRIHGNLVHPASVVVVHPLAKPESGDNESVESESTPLTTTELSTGKAGTDLDSDEDSEQTLFTDIMISDQNECYSLRCDMNAQCHLNAGSQTCLCLEGFTGDGQLCVELETTPSWVTVTSSPADVNRHPNSNSVESCPSTHESYCLYEGVCFYFPEMESYACNCVSGYMGERCQFSDLEWWELQQAEEEKRRNVVIAACMVVLISLLSIAACVTYCYGTRGLFGKQPSVDNMSETSVTDESMSETTTTSVPRFYMVVENGLEGKVIPAMGCPRRAVCPSCSSETGDNPMSEETRRLSKHNHGYECSMVSAVAMETTQHTVHHTSQLSSPYSYTTFKPTPLPQTPSEESPAS